MTDIFYAYSKDCFKKVYVQDLKKGDELALGNTGNGLYGVITIDTIVTNGDVYLLTYRLPRGAFVSSSTGMKIEIISYDEDGYPIVTVHYTRHYGDLLLKGK